MDADMSRRSRTHSTNWIGDIPVLGPEDIAIDHEAEIAYVSSQDRLRTKWWLPSVLGERTTDWNERGRIYSVDLRKGLTAQEMNVDLPPDRNFHPTGIDLYVSPSGDRRMFVVNWRAESEFSIEVFDIAEGELSHAETVTSSHLTLPNAIVALSKTHFYVSNSVSLPSSVQLFERTFCLPTGNVLFHDLDSGTTWPRVACGIPFANGLALDPKRNRLFVASTLSSRLLAFPFNPEKPWEPLSAPRTLVLDFMPDNLGWEDAKKDTLWVAGSEFLKSIPYMFMLSDTAPSHVARIPLADASATNPFEDVQTKRMYDNDGSEIAQCSVGVPYGAESERRFLVGSCFDDHISVFREAV